MTESGFKIRWSCLLRPNSSEKNVIFLLENPKTIYKDEKLYANYLRAIDFISLMAEIEAQNLPKNESTYSILIARYTGFSSWPISDFSISRLFYPI